MAQKIIIIGDPGIDTAFAIALAVHDPAFEVLGIVASAGNVSADQATRNMHILINQFDLPRWPRLGAALPVSYEINGTKLHGPEGLGNFTLPPVSLHQPLFGDKLLVELVREFPNEITVVVLGPATMLGRAIDRDPEITRLLDRIVLMGGSWHEMGNASAVAEFHFLCDPFAARQVLHCGASITMLPLDVTRKLIFSPSDLLELPNPQSVTCQFLREIVPYGIRASSNLYGIEGFHLKDVLAIAHLSLPHLVTTTSLRVDIETRGELTKGMSVIDNRPGTTSTPNVQMGIGVDIVGVRDYIHRILASTT